MAKYYTEKSEDFSLVDSHTGEILPFKQTRKIETKEFIMVFLANSYLLMNLPGNVLKVLICCWEYSTYNSAKEEEGNILFNGPGFKEACWKNGLEISGASIDNAVSTLCKKGLLIKRHRGEYLLNPEVFFKGRLANRDKALANIVLQKERDD